MTPPARLRTVVLDCPDPLALAEFYRSLIGGELSYDGDEPDWVVFEPQPGRRFALGDQSSSKARFSDRARLTLAANEAWKSAAKLGLSASMTRRRSNPGRPDTCGKKARSAIYSARSAPSRRNSAKNTGSRSTR